MSDKSLRTEIELLQTLEKHKGFTHINTTDASENAVLLGGSMEEGVKVSFVVELNDAYVEFDGDASSVSMLIPANTGYSEDGIYIKTKITIKNVNAGQNARIRGIIWGR